MILLVAIIGSGVWLRSFLHRSLPVLDGDLTLPGLAAPVMVERDSLGIPTITGETRIDVARATGFVHAQERFFQMDLARRRAAGELSELVGSAALPADKAARLHRMRAHARRAVAGASAESRAALEAYVEGVNAGLKALRAKPFEYLPLRTEPEPWRAEECVLVLASMFFVLQDS